MATVQLAAGLASGDIGSDELELLLKDAIYVPLQADYSRQTNVG